MNSLEEIKCYMPGTSDHFAEEPKALSCGDYVCSKCIISQTGIECKRCSKTNECDLAKVPVIKLVRSFIDVKMNEASEALYNMLRTVEDETKGNQRIKSIECFHLKTRRFF